MSVVDTNIVIERVKKDYEISENITEVSIANFPRLWTTKNFTEKF